MEIEKQKNGVTCQIQMRSY